MINDNENSAENEKWNDKDTTQKDLGLDLAKDTLNIKYILV